MATDSYSGFLEVPSKDDPYSTQSRVIVSVRGNDPTRINETSRGYDSVFDHMDTTWPDVVIVYTYTITTADGTWELRASASAGNLPTADSLIRAIPAPRAPATTHLKMLMETTQIPGDFNQMKINESYVCGHYLIRRLPNILSKNGIQIRLLEFSNRHIADSN